MPYDKATDIVEGIMVNVPSREAQARLIGVVSDIYVNSDWSPSGCRRVAVPSG